MNRLNEKKGITLIALIITISVLTILLGVTLYNGVSDIRTARNEKLLSELEIVKHAVYEAYTNYKKTGDEDFIIGTESNDFDSVASSMGVTLINPVANSIDKKYYELNSANLKDIGLTNISDTYIVNYYTR